MQHAPNPPVKRQSDPGPVPSVSGITGGTTAISVGLGSSLLLGPSASPLPSFTDSSNPVITTTNSVPTSPVSAPTSAVAVHPTKSSLSTGVVLGISAGVFVAIIATMFAVYMHFKRRTYAQARRPLTRGSPPTRGSRRLSSVSDEKANHSFDPASMPNFAQEFSAAPPSRPFVSSSEDSGVISLGGDTVADSFLSLQTSHSMSPSAVLVRQTPMTTDSALHRWESAEVLIMDDAVTDRPSVYSENPFSDDADDSRSSIDGNTRASSVNPFFNAYQHNPFADQAPRSRKSSVSTVKRSRANSVASRPTTRPATDNALLSLIAALDTGPVTREDQTHRASIQTAISTYTPVEGSATTLPMPKAF